MRKSNITLAQANPDLSLQWHPKKNGSLTPCDLSPNTHQKVWWLLPYDDPKTGKHFDFEWIASVAHRNRGEACPYLCGKAIWIGYNDLATTRPDLAHEFHPIKNGNLTPFDITENSNKTIWWLLPYDDPKTGKHFDFEWEASPSNRKSRGCPYLCGRAIWVGYNDLTTVCPDVANEWDYEKNKGMTPSEVTYGSKKKVWWKCKNGHSWKSSVCDRAHSGCPHCVKELGTSFPERVVYYYMSQIFTDARVGDKCAIGLELDIYIPSINVAIEYDGGKWHNDVSRDIKKNTMCKKKGIRLIRIREDGCPKMKSDENCFIVEIKGHTNHRLLSEAIKSVMTVLNKEIDVDIARDLAEIQNVIDYTAKQNSLAVFFPDIANEWHPTKNGKLTPDCVSAKSNMVVWWLLPYDDPKTGKHFDFEWTKAIDARTVRGYGCPFLSGHGVWPGFNDLKTLNNNLAEQWNYEKNNGLVNKFGEDISTPDKVTLHSNQEVWWKCSCGNEWKDRICGRARNVRRYCPACCNKTKKK